MAERRYYTNGERRVQGNSRIVTGYAAKFHKFSQDLGGWIEQIAPKTFSKTIKESDIKMLFNHDESNVLARNKNGTLELEEDEVGLRFKADIARTGPGNDLIELVRRKDVNQCSFGFRTIRDSWKNLDSTPERTLQEVVLLDTSIVTFPAYLDTTANVGLRHLTEIAGMDYRKVAEAIERAERVGQSVFTTDQRLIQKFANNLLDKFTDKPRFAKMKQRIKELGIRGLKIEPRHHGK